MFVAKAWFCHKKEEKIVLRNILSVLAGFVLWSALWLSANQALIAANAVGEDGATSSVPVLLLIIALSVVISVLSGYVTAALAREKAQKSALSLGALLLAVGIFVEATTWNLLPVWYHLGFLVLLIPAVQVGSKMRGARQMNRSTA